MLMFSKSLGFIGPLFDDVRTDFRYDTFRRLTANPTVTTTTRIIDGHIYDLVGRYSLPKAIGSGLLYQHGIVYYNVKLR